MRPMTAAMAAVHEEVHTAAQPEEKDQRQITYDMCLMLLPQEEPGDRQETQKYQSRTGENEVPETALFMFCHDVSLSDCGILSVSSASALDHLMALASDRDFTKY